jgi:hypothetical protein
MLTLKIVGLLRIFALRAARFDFHSNLLFENLGCDDFLRRLARPPGTILRQEFFKPSIFSSDLFVLPHDLHSSKRADLKVDEERHNCERAIERNAKTTTAGELNNSRDIDGSLRQHV